jgi:hypothetical protein
MMTMAMDPAARKAMFANIASNKLPGTGPALPRPPRAPRLSKGTGPMPASYASGGPVIQESRSRFMKTPNVFTTDIERTNYEKKSQGGELSDMSGDSKSRPPIKPRT